MTSSTNPSRTLQIEPPHFGDRHAELWQSQSSPPEPDEPALREARRYLEVCEEALAREENRATERMLNDPRYLEAKQAFEDAHSLAQCALSHSKRATSNLDCIGSLSTACLVALAERGGRTSWIDRLCARILQLPRLIELRSMYDRRATILQQYARLCDKRAEQFEDALTAIEMKRFYLPEVVQTRKDHASALSQYESLVRQHARRS